MKVLSTRFGALEIEAGKVIEMPEGMVGFPEQRRYALLPADKNALFCWLQSLDNPDLAFVVVDPMVFVPGYSVKLNSEEYDRLQLSPETEVVILVVATMAADPAQITVNLQGPIVVNPENMRAKQIVLEDVRQSTKFPLFGESSAPLQKGDRPEETSVAKLAAARPAGRPQASP